MALSALVQSREEIDRLIRAAIGEKASLRAIYAGGVRLLCPYMLGRNRDGQVRVLFLQIGGESASGLLRQDGRKFTRVERVRGRVAESTGFVTPSQLYRSD